MVIVSGAYVFFCPKNILDEIVFDIQQICPVRDAVLAHKANLTSSGSSCNPNNEFNCHNSLT